MKNLKKYIALMVIMAQLLWSINGYANPTGGSVVSGSATISTSGNTETINQASNKLITNWNSFSIAAGETTQFIQPNASSVALNRVVGSSPSDIYGALEANGKVFLINQNGILFAPGSQVNVGGLVASTLDISDANFLSGQYTDSTTGQVVNGYHFIGSGNFGSVINRGTININEPGGYAALLGSNVENSGAIVTTAGTVALAAGNEIAVNLDASGAISAVVVKAALSNNLSASINGILNTGTITANGGNVILTAQSLQNLFTNLINNEGVIEANGVSISGNGNVTLSNTISAQGGGVNITGAAVDMNNATITSTATGGTGAISVTSTSGNINVGTINAAGGTGDVNLNSATSITNNSGTGQITANNFNFTSGNVVGTQAAVNPALAGGHIVLNIQNSANSAGYTVYSSSNAAGPWVPVATVAATGGTSTPWTGPLASAGNAFYIVKVSTAATSAVGTSTNPIITNVNTINGQAHAGTTGDINLKQQAKAVTLSNLNAATGSINVTAAGPMNAQNVTTGGGSSDSINLTTTSGDLDVGTVNAAGGLGDVTLSSAAGITNNSGTGLVTANNFNFTSGNVVGTQAAVSPSVINGNIVLNIQNSGNSAGYTIYTSSSPAGPWVPVANVAATAGPSTSWTGPATTGSSGFFMVKVSGVTKSSVGTSTNPINTNVNTINGQANAGTAGDVNLKQGAKAVTLGNLNAEAGSINVTAAGSMTTQNVTTGGGALDSINLNTTSGGIDVGTINAAGGSGDVNLNSAASITNSTGSGLVTANNFNFSSGKVVGTSATVNPQVVNGNIVLNIQNPIEAQTYNIYSVVLGSAPQLIATIPASNGVTTQWVGPAIASAPNAFFEVRVASAVGVGTSTHPINTNVNTINGQANALTDGIYLNQAKAVTLGNLNAITGSINVNAAGPITAENVTTGSGGASDSINLTATTGDIAVNSVNAAGNVTLDSVNGSILGIGGGTNVSSGGNTALTAGNVIGSYPNAPLNVNVGNDLLLTIGNRDNNLAPGSVGPMGVSGILSGSVGGSIIPLPATPNPPSLTNGVFVGNPPGYIFFNKSEIWPKFGSTSTLTTGNINDTLAALQVNNVITPNQTVYYEKLDRHLIRQVEVAAPLGIYMYHSLVDSDNSAVDHIKLEPEAYDYIDQHINLINPLEPASQGEGQKPAPGGPASDEKQN